MVDCETGAPIYLGSNSGFPASSASYLPATSQADVCIFGKPWRAFDVEPNGLADVLLTETDTFSDPPERDTNLNALIAQPQGSSPPFSRSDANGIGANTIGFAGDYNGDGRSDIFYPGPNAFDNYAYVGIGDGHGGFVFDTGHTGLNSPGSLIADFDGDGCSDLLTIGATSTIIYSVLGYNALGTLKDADTCHPKVQTSDASVLNGLNTTFGDFNGDGITDVFAATGTSYTLYLSTGTGFAATTCAITLPPVALINFSNYKLYVGDVNGDGKDDLVLISPMGGTQHLVLLSTGTCFKQAATINNPTTSDTGITAVVADWNNDGAADVWIQKPSGDELYTASFVPEAIKTVDNGLGAVTTIAYDRLNKNSPFYRKCASPTTYHCAEDAYPTMPLDGAIYVVSEIDTGNGLGPCAPPTVTNCFSAAYSYAQAQSNINGRGFLGFAQVTITNRSTGIQQITTYATQFPQTGLIASETEVCPTPMCATAVTLRSTINMYDVVPLDAGTDGVARTFVALQESAVSGTDVDFSTGLTYPVPSTTTDYTYDCDAAVGQNSVCDTTIATGFGSATAVVETISLSGTVQSTKTTTNTFKDDPTDWYLGRLISAAVVSNVTGTPQLTRQTSFCYDLTNQAGTSCPVGPHNTGLLTQEIAEPEAATSSPLRLETDYAYDSFGNKTNATAKGCIWVSTPTVKCDPTQSTASRATGAVYDQTSLQGQFLTQAPKANLRVLLMRIPPTSRLAFLQVTPI